MFSETPSTGIRSDLTRPQDSTYTGVGQRNSGSFSDPTYTGLNRVSLKNLPDGEQGEVISLKQPQLRLGGRTSRFVPQSMFRDIHDIGPSRFDDKGSVLMANIDAVLNFSGHIGGYIAEGTEDNNQNFYSLLLEDHTLEMHAYIQWRRPLSVSRVVMARVLTRPDLKTAQLDTLLTTDMPAIISLKPCNGYNVVGLIAHGGGDPLTGSTSVTLKDLVVVALVSLTVINRTTGKAFVTFPFTPNQKVSGTMTHESVLDCAVLLTILYKKVWFFRPYMCHDLVCFGFAEPREDPEQGSLDEEKLMALWQAMNLLPAKSVSSTTEVDEDVEAVAQTSAIDDLIGDLPPDIGVSKGSIKLETSRNFSRLFDGTDVASLYPNLAMQVMDVLTEVETPEMARDRVEVLSRWQVPDTIETSRYPF